LSELLAPAVVSRLIGVIDLLDGTAVHAVGGHRQRYQPVAPCGGDAVSLAEMYLAQGVDKLYVADLDALAGRPVQSELIGRLCQQVESELVLIDVGWDGIDAARQSNAVRRLTERFHALAWIAATESMASPDAFELLVDIIGPQRCYLGLDFRGRELLTAGIGVAGTGRGNRDVSQADGDCRAAARRARLDPWINRAVNRGAAGAVILDLASVGVGAGPSTMDACRQIRHMVPHWTVVSGGGVRSAADVAALVDAGCKFCLVATAIQTLPDLERIV